MIRHTWTFLLLLAVAAPCHAGNAVLMFDYPLALRTNTRYVLHLATVADARVAASERVIDPLPVTRCSEWADLEPGPTTLCVTLCLAPGDYSVSVRAERGLERSTESVVFDADLTATDPCPGQPPPIPVGPPGVPPPPPGPPPGGGGGNPGWTIGGTAAILLAAQRTPPPLPELPNRHCVQWAITGVCLCGWPPHPCVSISYFEPGWLVEVVKHPGETTIPILGDVLKAALASAGVPAMGGGGAGNSSGSGQTNLHYAETHVYAYPQLLGGPCTGCAPSGGLAIHYASEIDASAWRTTIAVPSPLDLVTQIGVWGRLNPRGGHVIHSSEPVASALAAVRAMDIAKQPIGSPPNLDAHIVMQPVEERAACIQSAWPTKTGCFPPGYPPPLWETGTLSLSGRYLFVIHRRRTCCVEASQATCGITTPGIGGYGANVCPLPPIP